MAPGKKVAVLGCGPVGEQRAGMQFTLTCLFCLLTPSHSPSPAPSPQPPTPLCLALLLDMAALLSSHIGCMDHIVTECPLPFYTALRHRWSVLGRMA